MLGHYREILRDTTGEVFSIKPAPSSRESLKTMLDFSSETPKRERLQAFLELVRTVSPENFEEKIVDKWGHRFRSIPLAEGYNLHESYFSEGGVSRVFFLESEDSDKKSWVLKLPKNENIPAEEYIRQQRSEFLEIKETFSSLPDLVLDEEYFIMEGRRGNPTAATLQEYRGNLKDVFSEISDVEMQELFTEYPHLKEEVQLFTDIFDSDPDLLLQELDLLGPRNLCIDFDKEGPHLRLIDPHYRTSIYRSEETRNEIEQRASYLKALL